MLIPCYNETGDIVAYRPAPIQNPNRTQSTGFIPPSIPNPFIPQDPPPHSSPYPWGPYTFPGYPYSGSAPLAQALPTVANAAGSQPLNPGRNAGTYSALPGLSELPAKARNTSASPSSCSENFPSPPARSHPPPTRSRSVSSTSDEVEQGSKSKGSVEWDPWPDGNFERHLSWAEFHAAAELPVHWACETTGGDKRGSDTADDWIHGKKTRRRCRGIIRCKSTVCSIVVRPQTRMKGIQKQLLEPCRCGGRLIHVDCGLVSTLYSFSGGVHYVNGGTHDHPRPTHVLHLTSGERAKFTEIVQEHPTVGPLSLLVGRPGLEGPANSVAEISSVLFNKDRIKSERRAVKRQGIPNSDFAQFAQFEKDNPGFVIFSQFGAVTVIVMQTPFMVSQLVKNHIILRDAINGIVSDGAHGYFADPKDVLLMSSSYGLDLDSWVPGIMSYANGSTQEHFFFHFLCMFESMAAYAEKEGRKITDAAFKNVVDFSDAERQGFIQAFVGFWRRRKDDLRTDEELRQAAGALLKGCQQHYRAQVHRIKKISAVVHPGLQDAFVNQAMGLLEANDYAEFTERVGLLIQKFPKVDGWVGWWARECHAKMLFKAFREMPVQEWDSIPNTTNPQESQHYKIYSAIGKKHQLIPGLKGLRQLAHHYALLAAAATSGVKIRYGRAEDWKHGLRSRARQQNRSRQPRKDGRPPDTSKELLGRTRKKRAAAVTAATLNGLSSTAQTHRTPVERPSYRWKKNSCYLDTALELIFQTVTRDFHRQFGARAANLHAEEPITHLFEHMTFRKTIDEDNFDKTNPVVLQTLATKRDGFRKFLKRAKLVPDPYAYNPLFGWFDAMFSRQQDPTLNFAESYFQHQYILFRRCTGDEQIGEHFQIKRAVRQCYFALTGEMSQHYQGDVEKWFRELILINKAGEESPSCWRNIDDDGEPTCFGKAKLLQLILGIPVMLILEIPSPWVGSAPNEWDFPQNLRPLTLGAEALDGVVYDIVGRAFTNGGHFRASFTRDDKLVYEYDDMRNDGCALQIPGARVKTHLAGRILPESGWRTYAVYQVAAVRRLHAIQFSPPSDDDPAYKVPDILGLDIPNITQIDGEDRFWLRKPWSTDILDFISSHPPLPKSKHVHFADDLEEEGDDPPPQAKRRRPNHVITSDNEDDSKSSRPTISNQATNSESMVDEDDIEFSCSMQSSLPSRLPAERACIFGQASLPAQEKEEAAARQSTKNLAIEASSLPELKSGSPGKGALARRGAYWYPVRLIFKESDGWIVKWWRGNEYEQDQSPPPLKVAEPDLRDELWANASARRLIRTLLADPEAHLFIPAAEYARDQKSSKGRRFEMLHSGGIPYTGELRSLDCARVANWFHTFVPGAKDSVATWLGRVPVAHAYTILIAHRNQDKILQEIQSSPEFATTDRQATIFKIAWEYQKTQPAPRFTDVDRECLGFFEERLFENSFAAGRAGNQQWGLDAGHHQDDWSPYQNIPSHWNHADRDESESELQQGPHYKHMPDVDMPDANARPKRRPAVPRRTPKTLNKSN
ncbi:hypothetical protein DFH09DRAFT_1099690 [Mycena vulgaris]|nr:hypothetical protein DFH09DRAFT_1099690 [Mycena vulgaris]